MKAGEVKTGTELYFTGCHCEFITRGNDGPQYPSHIIFKLSKHCNTTFCNMKKDQVLWLFDTQDLMGTAGRYSFVLKNKAELEKIIKQLEI